ncbi:PepSY domain-containing protein [Streptomyces sp. NPDC057367]|uniref:PepSY domain-containing protein n=1 Tax=Streptomyces sp. NPDC057367 TaxID=3346108 RepID=UPI00362F1A8A
MVRLLMCTGTRRRARVPWVSASVAAGVLLVTGAGCEGPPPSPRPEVLPQVEAPYDRAVREALDEVSGSRLLSLALRGATEPEPVWYTRVAGRDGTVHVVRVGAVHGRLLGSSVPGGQTAADKERVAALADSAEVLPEVAVEQVKSPDFGKVSGIRLEKDRRDRTVWSVEVTTVRRDHAQTYLVDAVTKEILDRRTAAPAA